MLTQIGTEGLVYVNNAGIYTVYDRMQSVENNLSMESNGHISGVCEYVNDSTDGIETKQKTLVHNLLITGIDGDPSCGGDIFHNTCGHQQFEYQVEHHQMLNASDINITLATYARMNVNSCDTNSIGSLLYTHEVKYKTLGSHSVMAVSPTKQLDVWSSGIVSNHYGDPCIGSCISVPTEGSIVSDLYNTSIQARVGYCSENDNDTCGSLYTGSYASVIATDSIVFNQYGINMQAIYPYDCSIGQCSEDSKETCGFESDTSYCCVSYTYKSADKSSSQVSPGSVQNTPLCVHSNSKCTSFKLLVNRNLNNGTGSHKILQNGYFGALGDTNFTDLTNSTVLSRMVTQRILLATGELGRSTKYWCGVGFLPFNYVLPSFESSSKQLECADMMEWVKNANQVVNMSGKHNYLEARITVPSGLNIVNWRRFLDHYHLKILCEYLQFGFPYVSMKKYLIIIQKSPIMHLHYETPQVWTSTSQMRYGIRRCWLPLQIPLLRRCTTPLLWQGRNLMVVQGSLLIYPGLRVIVLIAVYLQIILIL